MDTTKTLRYIGRSDEVEVPVGILAAVVVARGDTGVFPADVADSLLLSGCQIDAHGVVTPVDPQWLLVADAPIPPENQDVN